MVIEKSVLILREGMLKYLMFQLLILKQFRKIMDVHMRGRQRVEGRREEYEGTHLGEGYKEVHFTVFPISSFEYISLK